jgi:hypothetical protein
LLRENNLNPYIIMGDCNARSANKQFIPDEMNLLTSNMKQCRQSKDQTVNHRGQKFLDLCSDHNLMILNGRMLGDKDGEFTFIDRKGSSVIDLCSVSIDLIQYIHNFAVLSHIYSDHMPIVLTSSLSEMECAITIIPLLPRLSCSNKIREKYQNKIHQMLSTVDVANANVQDTLSMLTNCVRKAAEKSSGT